MELQPVGRRHRTTIADQPAAARIPPNIMKERALLAVHGKRSLTRHSFGPAGYRDAMGLMPLIEVRGGVRSGKPCFVGTRITVYDVLEYLASGMTTNEIVHDFPELTDAHVRAAIEFAAMRERRLATPA